MLKSRILVVIDMQNDFLTGPLGCMEPERVCNNVLELLDSGKYDISIGGENNGNKK